MSERNEAAADREWWQAVGAEIDPAAQLYGWSYRHRASFLKPEINIDGVVAETIMRLRTERDRLAVELTEMNEELAATRATRDTIRNSAIDECAAEAIAFSSEWKEIHRKWPNRFIEERFLAADEIVDALLALKTKEPTDAKA